MRLALVNNASPGVAADGRDGRLVADVIRRPAWTLFALVGGAMIVFGLSAGSIRLTRWGK